MSPRRGLGLNQFSRSVRQEALQDDARARLCTIRQDLKALALYLYQADLRAHHHLPSGWYESAYAALEDLARYHDHKALTFYLYQANLHAHHYLPDDWYAGAQAMLDELKETVKRQGEEKALK